MRIVLGNPMVDFRAVVGSKGAKPMGREAIGILIAYTFLFDCMGFASRELQKANIDMYKKIHEQKYLHEVLICETKVPVSTEFRRKHPDHSSLQTPNLPCLDSQQQGLSWRCRTHASRH